jgi:hypothetical protein
VPGGEQWTGLRSDTAANASAPGSRDPREQLTVAPW